MAQISGFMRTSALLVAVLFFSLSARSQTIHRCASDEVYAQDVARNPQREVLRAETEAEMQRVVNAGAPESVLHQIPVVFHVMYYDQGDNISDAQIQSALQILNEDMRRINPDTGNLRAIFKGVAADMEVEFVLAKKGPNGECTSGINRQWSPNSLKANNAIKSELNWPNTKYLNIWVVRNIELAGVAPGSIVLGYSAFPYSGIPVTQDGVVIRHDHLGNIGTAAGTRNRTLTHEVGHYLNLYHTFQNGCGFGDQCADTPPVSTSSTGCNPNQNTCTIDSPDLPDMIENYMDYTDDGCMNTFTLDQKARAKAVLGSPVLRGNLTTAANLLATGVTGTLSCSPVADFELTRTLLCAGDVLTFEDRSAYLGNPTYHWNVLDANNQVVHHTTTQNPSLVMANPGQYTVSLTIQAANGSNTMNKPLALTVRPAAGTSYIPWFIGTMEAPLPNADWTTTTFADSSYWRRTTVASKQGAASYLFQNYKLPAGGEVSSLIAGPIAFPNTGTLNLRFAHAFVRRAASNNDQLKVFVSSDCGATWQLARLIPAFQLGINGAVTTPYVPAPTDWKYTTINLASLGLQGAGDLMIRFSMVSGGGNNLYLDDVQLTTTLSNEELIGPKMWVQPNPSRGGASLVGAEGLVRITDLSGRVVAELAAEGELALPDLAAGTYVLQSQSGVLRWLVL
ncbi:MAG: M43 family zinc metalloprotease [Schleiferiaceae bacterium]